VRGFVPVGVSRRARCAFLRLRAWGSGCPRRQERVSKTIGTATTPGPKPRMPMGSKCGPQSKRN
jgi:hypothetical protein